MELNPYYDKKVSCLHCNEEFHTTKIRSKFIKVKESESDFHPLYENDVFAYYYHVFVCEHCGFTFTEDFSPYFSPGTKDEIYTRINNNWVPHSFNGERSKEKALQAYMLALACGEIKQERHITLAGISLRIAWIYRELQQAAFEQRFLKIARNEYIDAFSNEDYIGTQMTDVRVLYLIAELSRRLGDRDEAVRYFSKVIEKQRETTDLKIIEMAKEAWQEMRAS